MKNLLNQSNKNGKHRREKQIHTVCKRANRGTWEFREENISLK